MQGKSKVRLRILSLAGLAVLLASGLLAAGCGGGGGADSTSSSSGESSSASAEGETGETYSIGFVSWDPSVEFWADSMDGAEQAAEKLPEVELTAQSATGRAPEVMIPVAENMLTRGVDVLVVTGVPQLKGIIERASREGVPVVSYANGLPELKDKIASTVATDNYVAGEKAGKFIEKELGGKGQIALLDIARGTYAILDQRVEGLEKALEGSEIEIVDHFDTNCEESKAVSVMQNILTSHSDLSAVFSACGEAALGAEQAIKQAGISTDEILSVGYDASEAELEAVEAGTQAASVAQFPVAIGRDAVETALKVAKGESVPAYVDTGSQLVTKANVAEFKNNPDR